MADAKVPARAPRQFCPLPWGQWQAALEGIRISDQRHLQGCVQLWSSRHRKGLELTEQVRRRPRKGSGTGAALLGQAEGAGGAQPGEVCFGKSPLMRSQSGLHSPAAPVGFPWPGYSLTNLSTGTCEGLCPKPLSLGGPVWSHAAGAAAAPGHCSTAFSRGAQVKHSVKSARLLCRGSWAAGRPGQALHIPQEEGMGMDIAARLLPWPMLPDQRKRGEEKLAWDVPESCFSAKQEDNSTESPKLDETKHKSHSLK